MKNWAKSLRDADKAIALKADWEKGWYRRGVALSNLQRYEEAMQAFQKCMDLNPSSKDYEAQYNQAKKDLYKGLSESEILKLEGNEVRRTANRTVGPAADEEAHAPWWHDGAF
jgi:tetratricopeptide (TPR) repeat protein